jgi:hypothetical protein
MQDKEQFNFKKFFLKIFIVIAICIFFFIFFAVLARLLRSNPNIWEVCKDYPTRESMGGSELIDYYIYTHLCFNIFGVSIREDTFIWLIGCLAVFLSWLTSIIVLRAMDGKETVSEELKEIRTKDVLLRVSVVVSLFFLSILFFIPFFSSDYPILGFFFPLIFTSLGSFFIFKQINKESKKVDKKSN